MKKTKIIIIGAGAAGLMAARELSTQCEILILEAGERLGGRIQTFNIPGFPEIIEGGAEFIHGSLPLTLGLLKEAGIDYLPITGKMYRREKENWIEQEDMIEGWDGLIEKMKGLETDMTMHDFLIDYYAEDKFASLRRRIISFVEGFDVADPKRVSVKALYEEWSNEEEENFRIPSGYGKLIDWLGRHCLDKGCRIITGDPVKQIDWQENDIAVYTTGGKKYLADKTIVTAPVSVLSSIAEKTSINITPPIDNYINAVRDIGFGPVIKVVFRFNKIFWKEDARFIFSDEMIPTWWSQSPLKTNILAGWVGGPKAANIAERSDDSLREIGINALANIFVIPADAIRKNISHSYIFNWLKYPEAMGAYSYATPGSAEARKLLNDPPGNSVFFAGEGLYSGPYPGTVEAALLSGKETAAKIAMLIEPQDSRDEAAAGHLNRL